MPVIKSAKKKLRQDKKRTTQNNIFRAALSDAIKKASKTPSAQALQNVSKIADKAAKQHIIHKNKAARIKSRLAILTAKTPSSPKTAAVKASRAKTPSAKTPRAQKTT